MTLFLDPVADMLLAAIAAALWLNRLAPEAPKRHIIKSGLPAAVRLDQDENHKSTPQCSHGDIEIVRILEGGGYSRTGMTRPDGHPDIAEALRDKSLAILRPDGNVEITPGEIEVSPHVDQ